MIGIGIGIGKRRGGGAVAPFTARFGDSTNNATGTGAFDTGLYQVFPPLDGTYGAFTVASGIITPDGTQTVGTYDVGGYPVEVLAGYKAIATQAEWDLLTDSDRSKTILVREAAAIVWDTGTAGFLYRVDALNTVVEGDGPDPRLTALDSAYDARRHFDYISWRALANVTVKGCRIVPTAVRKDAVEIRESVGFSVTTANITFEANAVIASRPLPFGDYTAGSSTFPGGYGFKGIPTVEGPRIIDNVFIGGLYAVRLTGGLWSEVIGNLSVYSYTDAFQISPGDNPVLFGGNMAALAVGKTSDTGSPHPDGLQVLPGEPVGNIIVESNIIFEGNTRGRENGQPFFLADSTAGYQAWMRDNVAIADALFPFSITTSIGSRMDHNAWAPSQYSTIPAASDRGRVRFGSVSISGSNAAANNICDTGSADVSVTQSGNVNTLSYSLAQWQAAYTDWTIGGVEVPTMQQVFAGMTSASGGHRVSFAGAERSSYQIAGLAAPVLSALTITSTISDSATATVQTTVDMNPIFWAVVPTGTTVANARDIKRRRVTGAVLYGRSMVKNGDAAGTIALDLAGALVVGTTYDLVCEQENGWTQVSSVARVAFTATSATLQFTEDWSTYTVGDTFTQLDAQYGRLSSAISGTILTEASAPSGKTCEYGSASHAWLGRDDADAAIAARTTERVQVLALFRLGNSTDARGGFGHYISASASTGFGIHRFGATSQAVYVRVNGDPNTTTNATVVGSGYSDGDLLWVRMEIDGTAIKGRVWLDGAGEPGTWTTRTEGSAISIPTMRLMGRRGNISLLYWSMGIGEDAL